MGKFIVECKLDNAAQYRGEEPHDDTRDNFIGDYIEAESKTEAVMDAIDILAENIREYNDGVIVETDYQNDMILVSLERNDEVIECYYDFAAEEIGKEE